ncbi:MAG: D-alanine--D-alanine ligase (EC [uncultured Campylobacterales bacterium]|uniref:D-alanine--D-alanine ligase n=1 Tax=uncultured Campylobacterales bacterium TaxID=352960 RepID=A0A6S6SFX2_9BACT|nr:MAG: D-alanine--D-alanine ligase (EC [uncultured Campylobacterales bacterium]
MKYSLLFGAQSFEHEISIVSAISVAKKLENEVAYIFCDTNREFYLIDSKELQSITFTNSKYKKYKKLELKNGGFFTKGIFSKKIDFDVCINLVHGADGEDGKLASMFDFYEIPFVGPRVEGCVLSFSKHLTKLYAKEVGVNVLDYIYTQKENTPNIKFDYPVIVKPTKSGSSMGIRVVKSEKELDYAFDTAYEYDTSAIVEPFIDGVEEYTLAGAKTGDDFEFSMIEKTQKEGLFDFDQKYLNFSRSDIIKEADLSDDIKNKMKQLFKKIYLNMFEGALIRCDFFVIKNEVYLVEINPIPGSMSNYLFNDFSGVLKRVASNLPKTKSIKINYEYINSIRENK